MIVSKDTHPERDFYYLGAKVIEIISKTDESNLNFFEIFEKLNASEKVSVNLFVLTLDWLYLIGAINKLEKGRIAKCF
jgi:hypothetical protein